MTEERERRVKKEKIKNIRWQKSKERDADNRERRFKKRQKAGGSEDRDRKKRGMRGEKEQREGER